VTLVGVDGWSRGNFWNWSWGDLWFSPLLAANGPTRDGETIFRVRQTGSIDQIPMRAGETLVVREPELATVRDLAKEAAASGAASAIYFQLFDFSPNSAFSASCLGPGIHHQPTVKWSSSTLLFTAGDDLPPRVFANGQRGNVLAVRSTGEWREAIPGTFDHVTTDAAGRHPVRGPLPLGVHDLFFWFAQAHDGEQIGTGYVRLEGDKKFQWQLLNLDPPDLWHPAD